MSPPTHRGSAARGRSHGQNLDRGMGLNEVFGGVGWAQKGRMGFQREGKAWGRRGTRGFQRASAFK